MGPKLAEPLSSRDQRMSHESSISLSRQGGVASKYPLGGTLCCEDKEPVDPMTSRTSAGRVHHVIRRVKSTPDPDTCEKVSRYTSHFYGILLQMYALPVAESSIYTTNLYHDTPPICIAILLRKY